MILSRSLPGLEVGDAAVPEPSAADGLSELCLHARVGGNDVHGELGGWRECGDEVEGCCAVVA